MLKFSLSYIWGFCYHCDLINQVTTHLLTPSMPQGARAFKAKTRQAFKATVGQPERALQPVKIIYCTEVKHIVTKSEKLEPIYQIEEVFGVSSHGFAADNDMATRILLAAN